MLRTPALAGAVAGLALWLTLGVLDAVDGPAGSVTRVAMLPPLWMASVFVVAGAALVVALAWLVSRVTRAHASDVTLPFLGAALLFLPFLPWLADALPVWTMMASPFVWVVWCAAIGLVARAVVLQMRPAATPHASDSTHAAATPRRTAAVFLATTLVCGAAASRLVETPIFPGGDEPHYLVIAQSIWRDGDLRIENNHRRGDTFEYFARPLKPDYLTRGVDREIYSIHPVGVAYLLAPVYALGGYRGTVAFLIVLAAAAATLAWRLAAHRVGARAATFGWAACALTAPWVFNSFTVYPEVPAAVAVLLVFTLACGLDNLCDRRALWLAMFTCGVAIATLPWLSSKYALMGAALGFVAMARLWLPRWLTDAGGAATAWTLRDRLVASALAALAPLISGVGWLAFFQIIWGKLSPSAPYGSQHAMDLSYLVAGGPGLFFDQEYGVVAVAPVLLLALSGLAGMLRRGGRDTRLALEIVVIGVSLLVTVAAFHIWWGGTAAVGRPIISALALLTLPCAWQIRAWSGSRARLAGAWLLLLASLAMMATMACSQDGLLLVAERDGTSRLLSYWAPAWHLWTLAPSFVVQPAPRALLITALWIAAAAIAFVSLGRLASVTSHGRAGLAAMLAAFVALTGGALAVGPVSGRDVPIGERRLANRARQPLLDTFDAAHRPLALVYDPWRRLRRADLTAGLFRYTADAAAPRSTPSPTLLLGARWALPAGEYAIDIAGSAPLTGELALQVGRAEPSIQTWMLDGSSRTWRLDRLALPVDVGFVGFKASPALEAARSRIVIRPLAVADVSSRLPAADVVQSRRYGAASAFFHDDNADPEPAGFWTRRDRLTRVTLMRDEGADLTVRVRSGPAAARVAVRSLCAPRAETPCAAITETVALDANTARDIALRTRGPVRLEIDTRGGFVPAEVDRASRDARGLGAWIEVQP